MMSERVESREREYTYTYIRIRIRKVTLYVPEIKKSVVEQAKTILKREGRSLSNLFLEQLESYVRLHEPGNPQQRLDTILKIGKAYHAPSKICGFKDCMRDAVGIAVYLPRNEPYGFCLVHKKDVVESARLWRVLTPRGRD